MLEVFVSRFIECDGQEGRVTWGEERMNGKSRRRRGGDFLLMECRTTAEFRSLRLADEERRALRED